LKALSVVVVFLLLLLATVALVAMDSLKPQPVAVGCGSVITTDTTLSKNIGPCSGNGLVIGHNDITLNCAGGTISGTRTNDTGVGIRLAGMTRVTVENCNVTGFQNGILLSNSSINTLANNTASANGDDGFVLASCFHDTLRENTANGNDAYSNSTYYNTNYNSQDGFYLNSSTSNTLTENTASSNIRGFVISDSSDNTLTGNTADNNSGSGFRFSGSSGNTLTGNTSDNNTKDGFVLQDFANNNKLTGNTASSNWDGL